MSPRLRCGLSGWQALRVILACVAMVAILLYLVPP